MVARMPSTTALASAGAMNCQADTPAELHRYLQNAIELEHSTIPPYLTAMFSLRPGVNRRIGELIRYGRSRGVAGRDRGGSAAGRVRGGSAAGDGRLRC